MLALKPSLSFPPRKQVFEVETSLHSNMTAADRCKELASMVKIPGEMINLQCYDTSTPNSVVSSLDYNSSSAAVVDSKHGHQHRDDHRDCGRSPRRHRDW